MKEEKLMSNTEKDFYVYLREQFNDLPSAKVFAIKFAEEMDQKIEGYGSFSCRAMAYHISQALEGKFYKDEDNTCLTYYANTKYGSDIVNSMWAHTK